MDKAKEKAVQTAFLSSLQVAMNANEWGAGGGMRGNAYDLVDDDDEDDDELYGRPGGLGVGSRYSH